LTSILKVDNLQDSSGTGTPYIKGAVLQVKYFQLTATPTVPYGTTLTDMVVPNFIVNITPRSTSSIIKLECNLVFEWANNAWDTMWFFYRNSTKLGGFQEGIRMTGISPSLSSHSQPSSTNNDSTLEFATLTYFDAPTTTSAIDYKLGVVSNGTNSIFINKTISGTNNAARERGVSFISATEIGG